MPNRYTVQTSSDYDANGNKIFGILIGEASKPEKIICSSCGGKVGPLIDVRKLNKFTKADEMKPNKAPNK